MRTIEEIRAELNKVDDELLSAYQKRMSLVDEMAKVKKASGVNTFSPEREKEIFSRLEKKSGALAPYVVELYETVLATSKRYQNALREGDEV